MLHITLDSLCYIVTRMREFQSKTEVVIAQTPSSPSEDWALQVLADHSGDYNLSELLEFIGEMNQRQRAELVALMWLGRGDYDIDDWETAVDDAIGDHSVRAAEYLLGHPTVSEYLEEGLIAHGYTCDE